MFTQDTYQKTRGTTSAREFCAKTCSVPASWYFKSHSSWALHIELSSLGLLMNSEVWVCLTDEERCIPFVLAGLGYDVWVGLGFP